MDREKVIAGLEFTKAMITFNPSTGENIEPENLNEADKTTYDACVGAIALLKEYQEKQEGLLPAWQDRTQEHICQKCGGIVWQEDNYCSKCGQAVKWK